MKLYRFSPIRNEAQLLKAVKYVAVQNTKLCRKITGKEFPMSSLTIFSHYDYEYEKLVIILQKIGKYYNENNGLRVALHKPIKVGKHSITHLRIRKPDPYCMHVGCGDFDVNYYEFKKKFSGKGLRLITGRNMIEFFDPDFDTLGYVVRS